MLAQFQERYPQASLLSQLLTIYQGKFVVQVSVQLEGVIIATGMAAAETIEVAEDRARLRAITLVANQEVAASMPQESVVSIPELTNTNSVPQETIVSIPELTRANSVADLSGLAPTEKYPEFASTNSKDYFLPTLNFDPVVGEDFGMESTTPTSNSIPAFNEVTPFVSRISQEDTPLLDPLAATEPIDLSDTLIAIETELRNLRWTAEQERKYIHRIYKKASRDLLSTEQLFEFLNYLQVFAQTSKELTRLGWDNQQGQDYLMENYHKKSRQYLTYQELQEFLQHLQAMS